MQKIDSANSLRDAITELESEQTEEGKILKEQFHLVYESMRPINLIKSTFKEVVASEELKDHLINTSVGLAAGYVSKILFQGVSHGPLRKLFGTVLMYGVTNVVAKNPEVVKSLGRAFLKIVISKPDENAHEIGTYHKETAS